MDVAEQSLTALEMLSRRHGKAILQAVSKTIFPGLINKCLIPVRIRLCKEVENFSSIYQVSRRAQTSWTVI